MTRGIMTERRLSSGEVIMNRDYFQITGDG